MVAVGTNKGIVKIYGMIGAKHLYSLVDSEVRETNLPAVCCNWLGQEKLVVGYASGKIKVYIKIETFVGKQNFAFCHKKTCMYL